MSHASLLTSALAVLALGGGAIGYAATEKLPEEMHRVGSAIVGSTASAPQAPPRAADLTVDVSGDEGLAAALLRSGVGGLDASLAERVAGSSNGRADLWLGREVGPNARELVRLTLRDKPGRLLVIDRQGDGFTRREVVEVVDETPVRLRLDGGAGLAAGLVEAGLPRAIRNQVLDHVAGERLAAIDLIAAHQASGSGSRYGELLYLGANLADGSIRRWVGEKGHLRPLGSDRASAEALLRPLPGPVTSRPGLRFHPVLRYLRWHRGTDFAAPTGTPIQAALKGRVVAAGWRGGYGRAVRIAHDDGTTTLYGHLSEIDVVSGQLVARGAVIGKVGSSGLATGPHLHFEWQQGGATLRPEFSIDRMAGTRAGPAQQAALRALLSAPFRLPPDRRS